MLLTKIARRVQAIASSIAAMRHGTTHIGKVEVQSGIRRVRKIKPGFDRTSIASLSLFVTMTAIFTGAFLILFGELEIDRGHPQRYIAELGPLEIDRELPQSYVAELGPQEIVRELPQRLSDMPGIQRVAPAPSAPAIPQQSVPTPERLRPGTFTLVTGSFEAMGNVIDGDTLAAGPRRIRLHGIDAPELEQRCQNGREPVDCGSVAAEELRSLVSGTRVTCKIAERDRYKREIGTCFRDDGMNINERMVESGWAIAYRRYSHAYDKAEAYARSRRLGLWSGTFEPPEEWRARMH